VSIYIIAELGINHQGSLEIAKQLMDAAKEAGADAVKFQKRTIEAVYTSEELAKPRDSVFGSTTAALKFGLEFGQDAYESLDTYCRAVDLAWSASCWDEDSVHIIARFAPPWLKIPSALITDHALLEAYRATGIPLIMSTGMSTEREVDAAVGVLHDCKLVLLHCCASYPAPIQEVNLSALLTMHQRYGLPVGYSSHTVSPWPAVMAAVLGAPVIEAHLTLDRTMWGSDQAASLEPKAFAKMVEEIRTWEQARGDGIKRVMPSELPIQEKLRKVHGTLDVFHS
jgi:N-acetylneuraminate synthase